MSKSMNSDGKVEISFDSDPLSESHLYLLSVSASSDSCKNTESAEQLLELRKLRHENQNMRNQLQMAEETNSQLNLELESEAATSKEKQKKIEQLAGFLDQRTREVDQLRRYVEELTMRNNDLEKQSNNQLIVHKEQRVEMLKCESKLADATIELDRTKEELAKSAKELAKSKSVVSTLRTENETLEQKLVDANIKLAQSEESIAALNQTIEELCAEKESLVDKLEYANEMFAKSTTKLLSKTYLTNQSANSNMSNMRTSSSMSENLEFMDESVSLINLHIAASLTENTFHLSPNDVNFYNERLRSNSRSLIGSNMSLSAIEDESKSTLEESGRPKNQAKPRLDANNNPEDDSFLLNKSAAQESDRPRERSLVRRKVRVSDEAERPNALDPSPTSSTNNMLQKERVCRSSPQPETPAAQKKLKSALKCKSPSPAGQETFFSHVYAQISQDSFKRLRHLVSICLIIFSIIILLMAVLQERDVFGSIIRVVFDNIEIKPHGPSTRPN